MSQQKYEAENRLSLEFTIPKHVNRYVFKQFPFVLNRNSIKCKYSVLSSKYGFS